jgi:hypothetical protein
MTTTTKTPENEVPAQIYADMLRVSPATAKTVIAHARNQYRYKALAELWGITSFTQATGSTTEPRISLSDEERMMPDTAAVNRLSRYCLRYMADRLEAMERMCTGYRYIPDRELMRLFTVKVWALACAKYKDETSPTKLALAEAAIAKEMAAVFAHWAIRIMEINTDRAQVNNPQHYRFMNSAYSLYVERPTA